MKVVAWCPECRSRREVVDQHDESYYEGACEVGYIVTDFDCGHESTTMPRVIGRSPGGESMAEDQAQAALRHRQSTWEQA